MLVMYAYSYVCDDLIYNGTYVCYYIYNNLMFFFSQFLQIKLALNI